MAAGSIAQAEVGPATPIILSDLPSSMAVKAATQTSDDVPLIKGQAPRRTETIVAVPGRNVDHVGFTFSAPSPEDGEELMNGLRAFTYNEILSSRHVSYHG
jgi:hypothetical protein